jgi:alginate O-acetyltransferase complex protein AlgI
MGLWIAETSYSSKKKKTILAIAIIINILMLFYFKYFGFSVRAINKIFRIINYPQFQLPVVNIVLPIGISFYTFQSISYLIDMYKEPLLVQRNPLDLGLYISFFPQLIAGPIVRYHDINEQIKQRSHSIDLFTEGIERFIIGLAKKVLIANAMALVADIILSLLPDSVSVFYLFLGILSYTLQIYYDFSGYSDMAIGLGKMFGFGILENFNYPYTAKSITDFWRRWHISLSNWFKDYLYIPLGGNRKGRIRTTLNLFIVFLTTGLWHGAALNFVFWGLGHGVLLFAEKTFGKKIGAFSKNRFIKNILSRIYALSSVILLWVFFRLGIRQSFNFIKNLLLFNRGNENVQAYISMFIDRQFYICLVIAILCAFPWWRRITLPKSIFITLIRYAVLIALLVLSICNLANNSYNPFIYFRF